MLDGVYREASEFAIGKDLISAIEVIQTGYELRDSGLKANISLPLEPVCFFVLVEAPATGDVDKVRW